MASRPKSATDGQISEARYRRLFNNMAEGVSSCRIVLEDGVPSDFVYLDVNPAFLALTGLGEVVGKRVSELIPGFCDSNPEVIAAYGRVATTGHPERFESFVPQLARWYSVSAYRTHPGEFTSVFQEVTDRKRTEDRLREERFLMNTLMDTIPDAIYFKDAQSRFIRVNRACAEHSGVSDPSSLVGKSDFDLFGREHAEAALRTEQEILRTGQPVMDQEEEESWPGRPNAWVSSTKMPLRDAGGAVIGTFGISRDITHRKEAEEALRRSEHEFRSLVEHAPVGIYRSSPTGALLTVNPALIRMLGYRWAEELLRLNVRDDVYADPLERDRLVAQFHASEVASAEAQWKRKDGSLVTVRLYVRTVRNERGAVDCFEGMVEDVTQQRSLESQFRQAQRLEAVGRLAGGVAHDFNNILTAITGYADLLLEDLGPEDPHRADVEEIRASALRAGALTRQLLAFSRKQVFQTRVLDLNTVVRTLDKMLRRLIGEDVKLELALGA
ncbi:MAG TPA: PAS domain S-box protein, partial [Solirubrobacteraceae bacterium]|nr:PAS domain S-box protein [Solirubrobacteraceae bacterium]